MYSKRAALYDEQTNYGLITEKQKEWNEKVAVEPDSLKDFENKDYCKLPTNLIASTASFTS